MRIGNHPSRCGLSCLFILLVLSLVSCLPVSAETIRNFESVVSISPSGDLDVKERIEVDYRGNTSRHHLYRSIPLESKSDGVERPVHVNVKSVARDNGEPVRANCFASGRVLNIEIGDPQQPLKGIHVYNIEYEMHNAIWFRKDHPALFLNATGERWPFPIQKATLRVVPPAGVELPQLIPASNTFIGEAGRFKRAGTGRVSQDAIVFSASDIPAGKSMAIGLELPRGSVVLPSMLQEVAWRVKSAYQIFLLPVATTLVLAGWWYFYGRDPGGTKPPRDAWKPPEYLTPAEVGTLVDEHCDLSDVVSTVIDLAVKGFIKIRVVPFNGYLYLGNQDYEFTLLKSPLDKGLKPHEQLFLAGIFGLTSTTYLTALKGRFAEYIPILRQRIYDSLVQEGYFERHPEVDRRNFLSVGWAVITVGLALLLASSMHMSGKASAVGTMLSGAVLLLASGAMPKRTSNGVKALKQSENFKRFLTEADKVELQSIVEHDPEVFSRFLPYALVLGHPDLWARAFKTKVSAYPSWYEVHPSLRSGEFDSVQFVSELGRGMAMINKALLEKEPVTVSAGTRSFRDFRNKL